MVSCEKGCFTAPCVPLAWSRTELNPCHALPNSNCVVTADSGLLPIGLGEGEAARRGPAFAFGCGAAGLARSKTLARARMRQKARSGWELRGRAGVRRSLFTGGSVTTKAQRGEGLLGGLGSKNGRLGEASLPAKSGTDGAGPAMAPSVVSQPSLYNVRGRTAEE